RSAACGRAMSMRRAAAGAVKPLALQNAVGIFYTWHGIAASTGSIWRFINWLCPWHGTCFSRGRRTVRFVRLRKGVPMNRSLLSGVAVATVGGLVGLPAGPAEAANTFAGCPQTNFTNNATTPANCNEVITFTAAGGI